MGSQLEQDIVTPKVDQRPPLPPGYGRVCASCITRSLPKDITAVLPGTAANPYFDGYDVNSFLDRFECIQELHYPEEDDIAKIKRLCQNVADGLAPRVKLLASGSCDDWDYFASRMAVAYRDQDPYLHMGTRK
jgi:hypothetical protein